MLDKSFLEKLSNANGIAADEQQVRDVLNEHLSSFATDVICDGMGSIIFKHVDNVNIKCEDELPRIMMAAHIDEVGYSVMEINDLGHLVLRAIGSTKPLAAFGQKVTVTTATGKQYTGYLNGTFENTLNSKKSLAGSTDLPAEIPGNIYVDLGLNCADEAYELGIQIGDMVTFASRFETLSKQNLVMGKALDDRIGCYIMGRVLENLATGDANKSSHPNAIFAAGTTAEEIGIRGARTSSAVVDPTVGIVIDTTYHGDEFDRGSSNNCQIGKGPVIVYGDRRCIGNKNIAAFVNKVADDLDIPVQRDLFKTYGTDAGNICWHNGGVPTATICIPLRYCHTAYSIADLNDADGAVKLICELIARMDADTCRSFYKFI